MGGDIQAGSRGPICMVDGYGRWAWPKPVGLQDTVGTGARRPWEDKQDLGLLVPGLGSYATLTPPHGIRLGRAA